MNLYKIKQTVILALTRHLMRPLTRHLTRQVTRQKGKVKGGKGRSQQELHAGMRNKTNGSDRSENGRSATVTRWKRVNLLTRWKRVSKPDASGNEEGEQKETTGNERTSGHLMRFHTCWNASDVLTRLHTCGNAS